MEIDSSAWSGDEKENNKRLRALIGQGAKIAGGAVGAALGFFAGGPAGAAALGAAGSMVSEALAHIGDDVSQRMLGPREKVRVGGVLAMSAAKIQERLDAGEQIRDDDFFDKKVDGRSDADEVAESILLKAQRESEEKKLQYMSNLLASIAFQPWVTVAVAQQLAKAAESLTYRQICILAAIPKMNKVALRQSNYRDQTQFQSPLLDLLYEIYDLVQRGYISNGGEVALGITDINPSQLELQGMGAHLFNLMGLYQMHTPGMDTIKDALK